MDPSRALHKQTVSAGEGSLRELPQSVEDVCTSDLGRRFTFGLQLQ